MTDLSHMFTKCRDNDPGVCESDDEQKKTQHPEITDKASVSAADEIRYYKCNFLMKNQNADVHLMQQLGELLMMIIWALILNPVVTGRVYQLLH